LHIFTSAHPDTRQKLRKNNFFFFRNFRLAIFAGLTADVGMIAGITPASSDENPNVEPDCANGAHNQRSLLGLAFRSHNFVRGD
jgi:hypothetical protein